MVNDEIINKVLNDFDDFKIKNKDFVLCYICYLKLKEYLVEKESLDEEETREVLIFLFAFEKNINKVKNKEMKKELQDYLKELDFNFELFKSFVKEKLKVKNEDIQAKIKEIIKTIEIIQKQKELKKQKDKNINEDVKNILGNDNLSL